MSANACIIIRATAEKDECRRPEPDGKSVEFPRNSAYCPVQPSVENGPRPEENAGSLGHRILKPTQLK